MKQEEQVKTGVDLLSKLEHEELSLSDAIDRLEMITTSPTVIRQILDQADDDGIIERDTQEGTVKPSGGSFLRFESEVIIKTGDFECKRCSASISTGHFMNLPSGEFGPFGSTCIKYVTGRKTESE